MVTAVLDARAIVARPGAIPGASAGSNARCRIQPRRLPREVPHVRSRLALLVAPLLLLSLVPAAVSAAPPRDAKAAHHAKVLAYWTRERIANARPRDFTWDAVRGFQPKAKPGTGGGGTVTGASWTAGGNILTGTGRVLFTLSGTDYICSGSVVRESNSAKAIVLTAGHCVVENDGTFATNWLFIPSFDTAPTYTCANTTYGCWVADELYADAAFASAGSFNDTAVQHDWAFAVVSGGGKSNTAQLDTTVGGAFGIAFSGVSSGNTLSAFGYPAAGKYHGNDLVYCKGPIGTDPGTGGTTWSMACDMTGGSSGGPWVSTTTTNYTYASTTLRSLNSYGYSGIRNMYGPKFNSNTQAVFNSAVNGTLGSGVVRTTLP